MVRVVPRVLDGDIPKEKAIRPQDVVRPGLHLPSSPKHSPRPPIPTPPEFPWKEMLVHVL